MDGIFVKKKTNTISIKLEKHNIQSEITRQFQLLKNALLQPATPIKEETKILHLVRALYTEILNSQSTSSTRQKLYNQITVYSSSPKNQVFNYIENLSEDAKAFLQKKQQVPFRSYRQRTSSPIPSSSSPKSSNRPPTPYQSSQYPTTPEAKNYFANWLAKTKQNPSDKVESIFKPTSSIFPSSVIHSSFNIDNDINNEDEVILVQNDSSEEEEEPILTMNQQ